MLIPCILASAMPRAPSIRCRTAARLLSRAFQPILISTLLLLVVSLLASGTPGYRLAWFAITAGIATGLPVAFILVGIRRGKAEDLDLRNRLQRPLPLLVALVCSAGAAALVWWADGPHGLLVALLAGFAPGVALTVITLWWKISFHSATLAGATVVLWWLLGTWALMGLIALVAVGWSRVVLGRHTPAQVLAGAAVGLGGSLLVVLATGG